MNATIAHVAEKVRGTKQWAGPSLKLVVLPEYFLTCYPQGESVAAWADKAALEIDGPEYEALAKIAQDNKIFLAGNAYETDRHFPGYYFQTCFVVDPAGKVVLRYRRLNSMFAPTPHDVWDKYLDLYGLNGVFPVARTEIGNLAAIASEEILYPEIARCFAMRGAEVFIHPTSESGTPQQTFKDVAKLARAIENMAYVVSCNTGGLHDILRGLQFLAGLGLPPQTSQQLRAKTLQLGAMGRMRLDPSSDHSESPLSHGCIEEFQRL